jgi:NAD(P)-dependent dehydrogenase (short-subunit alcohol dehydrogenase family)
VRGNDAVRLENQVAIVTGASSGNGRAIALALAAEGARVVCSDVRKQAREGGYETDIASDTDSVIKQRGGQAIFVKADTSRAGDVEGLVQRAVETWSRVDIMVNNAGVFTGLKTIVDETEQDYDFTMAVNAKGVWLGCKYAIMQMLKQQPRADGVRGRIINIASIGGLVGLAQEPAYCASKGAVVNLTRQLALDFAPHKINVNAVCPGFLATAMVRPFLEDPELKAALEALTPWPRVGTAQDVAKIAVFLASDDAEWVTGSMFTADGGFTAR